MGFFVRRAAARSPGSPPPYAGWLVVAADAVLIAPLFVGDYTWRPPGTYTRERALARAYETGVVCTDVRFEEVSVGYPREWRGRPTPPGRPRTILPALTRPTG